MRAQDSESTDGRTTVDDREVVALVIARDDGTCSVAWGVPFSVWEHLPGVWPNAQEAKRAVERVIGQEVRWHHAEPRIWEGWLSAGDPEAIESVLWREGDHIVVTYADNTCDLRPGTRERAEAMAKGAGLTPVVGTTVGREEWAREPESSGVIE